ncbi:C1 family peptidase [uncultured Dokdonia sp.]|uniref:C1 family peptidase n=1 Tax=uncultured Dokdonia sp. TaxID=575653 RepID=UPI00261D9C95|nr:C1 family peptidase [uncultured Dokdonia sp.]
MKKFTFYIILVFAFAKAGLAQETNAAYIFTDLIDLEANEVISQGNTGTCWSFSTSSFLESEVYRITRKKVDLSEMYTVRTTYPMKAENYVMRQGKAQFSEGGLAHDVLNSVAQFGLVPIDAYTGLAPTENKHNHAEMVTVIEAMLNAYIENPGRRLSKKWKPAVNAVLDTYLGDKIDNFSFENKQYTPKEFATAMGIKPSEYVSLTSFTHVPFYTSFILNIPDNFSNGSFYNIQLDEFIKSIDNALEKGYTLTLDCDVSELSFSSKQGVAVIPAQKENEKLAVLGPEEEKVITQKYRQDEFENYNTTDDHLMHITGKAKDQNGTIYYKVKNSWGTNPDRTAYNGYVYMSVSYIKLKAISVLMHRGGLPSSISEKIKL